MIDPPRIANLLSAGQHNLNYFVKKRKNKVCKVCKSVFDPPIKKKKKYSCMHSMPMF